MPRRRSYRTYALILACLLITVFVFSREKNSAADGPYQQTISDEDAAKVWLDEQRLFWKQLHTDLEDYRPKTWSLLHPKRTSLDVPYVKSSTRPRPDALFISSGQRTILRKAHAAFVTKISAQQYHLPYRPGTRGIVTTAGSKNLPVALVSLRMLRRAGSTLPVEVILADWSEVDPTICAYIMPSLNAACVILEDIIDPGVYIKKYQFKAMAILFSTFEEVLFLDYDCFPLSDPDTLFTTKAFMDTGLVLWPDFWFASESPEFFTIAKIPIPMIVDSPSIEAGQIMYSKRKHEQSILLAAYYNYYGPEFYYPLQSQGAQGEGDKETFLLSAIALKKPYYTVKTPVQSLGYWNQKRAWVGSAMAQFSPADDIISPEGEQSDWTRPFFLHVNFPKIDPGQIFIPPPHKSFNTISPVFDSDLSVRRIWWDTHEAAYAFFHADVEKAMWWEVWNIACQFEKTLGAWQGKEDICRNATEYYREVFFTAGVESGE